MVALPRDECHHHEDEVLLTIGTQLSPHKTNVPVCKTPYEIKMNGWFKKEKEDKRGEKVATGTLP